MRRLSQKQGLWSPQAWGSPWLQEAVQENIDRSRRLNLSLSVYSRLLQERQGTGQHTVGLPLTPEADSEPKSESCWWEWRAWSRDCQPVARGQDTGVRVRPSRIHRLSSGNTQSRTGRFHGNIGTLGFSWRIRAGTPLPRTTEKWHPAHLTWLAPISKPNICFFHWLSLNFKRLPPRSDTPYFN